MDLELTRVDYGNIGTTLPNCIKLLPTENKKQQKVVVGDLDGNLQLFSIKKSQVQIHFQTYIGKRISCIQLSGALGGPQDKIFVASDNIVKGFNKKGKMFLSFDTNLTESIKCMFVSGADLIACGNHVYTHFRDCKDIGTYLCGDTIVDVVALCPNNTNRILTILACSGRVLRILEYCRVRQTIELDSVPTVLHVPKNVYGDRLICGFADGKISIFHFGHFSGDVKQQILIKPEQNPNAITCIDTHDMSNDGKDELLIGRRDGTVQVFALPFEDDYDMEPRQLYRECFPESISGIQGGNVYSNGFVEIIVLSYSGNIFGLTTQVISVSLSDKHVIRERIQPSKSIPLPEESSTSNTTDAGITISSAVNSSIGIGGRVNSAATAISLRTIMSSTTKTTATNLEYPSEQIDTVNEHFKLSLVKPQENYRLTTQLTTSGLSSESIFDINDSLTLNKINASYNLFIEMPIQIVEILIKSEPLIDIIDLDNNNTAIINENEINLTSGYNFSAVAKLKNTKNHFEIEFLTVEGQYGNIEALIVTNLISNSSQMRTYLIRPLSLHMRIHTFDTNRPFNRLLLKGLFTQSDIHTWVEKCIPEVPERLETNEINIFYFKNVLIETILECKYGKGNAQFRSDNLSTISILKDFLTKEATKKRIKLEIVSDINEASIPHVLKLIEPLITECLKIKNDHKFLKALLQVDIRNDEDFNTLMPEYQAILKRRNEIETEYEKISAKFGRYFGIITDFYIDRYKFKGIFVKDKIPELVKLLENYNYDEIFALFNEIKKTEINTKEI